jgi:putative heme-binding domain-containing protein
VRQLALLTCAFTLCLGIAQAEEGFQSLFNGKDLAGWDGNPELWSVQDGVITGKTRGQLRQNQFLIWTGGTPADFELRLEFRFEGEANTGVQYRSQRRPDLGEWVVAGYQADIHSNPPYTAMLYDERGRGIIAQRGQKVVIDAKGHKDVTSLEVPVEPVDLNKWHELIILCQGNHLIHRLDGMAAIDVIDEQESDRDLEGVIAFQLHVGPASTAQFRNIRLKNLKKNENSQSQTPAARPEKELPKWVWLQRKDKPAKKLFLRKEFQVASPVSNAQLFVSADDKAKVFLNGKEVADHSGHTSASYVDVTALLQSPNLPLNGPCVIAIEAENKGGAAAALIQLDLESAGKRTQVIVTDDTWLVSPSSKGEWKAAGFANDNWVPAEIVKRLGESPYPLTEEQILSATRLKEPEATPVERLIVAKDFKVERLYTVPKLVEGSWVSMCHDPQGRLIVCDQYGGLFRVTPPGIGGASKLLIEHIDVPIGEAQGLLWAFDKLYVVVNGTGKYESGVYCVTDTDGDDKLDKVEQLQAISGGGEHGPHAAILSPDGQSIYIVCGDASKMFDFTTSRVPPLWDEDGMLPRVYGKGFMKTVPAPGGYVWKMSPDGKTSELITVGFRNSYDIAFNADGELFTYDADMEWDINTPWYRPTRICQVLSGVDYGWRNGSAKFPEFYADTMPPVVNIGPGSPTGICFGYNAKFPAKYQKALFINDWSYGKLYAVHMQPEGAGYRATFEEFITGTPLPLTDIVVNPVDGALYFAIGGRKVQSGLYRVTYTGPESTAPVDAKNAAGAEARDQLHRLQALHVGDHPKAVDTAWPFLASEDHVLRAAARTAIEKRPVEEWGTRALMEKNSTARLESLLALCRVNERPTRNVNEAVDTVPPKWDGTETGPGPARSVTQVSILNALGEADWTQQSLKHQLAGLRILQLAMLRLGAPEAQLRDAILTRIDGLLPTKNPALNMMLLDILVYLQSPKAAEQGIALLEQAPSQEEQINYARSLCYLENGWTPPLRETYFRWFLKAATYRGGVGFELFVKDIRDEALRHLSKEETEHLKPILDQQPELTGPPADAAPRPLVKEWKMDELLLLLQNKLSNRDFNHGRQMFGDARCFGCHRFNGEGGALGPDLTGLAGRFDSRAILESVVEPSKVISDQYAAVQIQTLSGKVVVGRIVNLHGHIMSVNTNMLDPKAIQNVDQREIEVMAPSRVSMMPVGLLNTLNEEEILDLMAFLLSRGDRNNPMFKGATAPQAAR